MSAYQYEAIEVLVFWRERILAAHAFKDHVVLGENLRLPGVSGKNLLVRRGSYFGLNVGPGTTAISQTAAGSRTLDSGMHVLESDETVRLSLPNNLLSLECRRIAYPPQAAASSAIDWSTSEVAGGVLALAVTLLLAGYSTLVRAPNLLRDEKRDIEKIAKVKFQFQKPEPISRASKPAARPSAPSARTQARENNLLTTFQSGGLQTEMNRLKESSTSVERAAGEAVGGNGRAQSVTVVGLKETESGANGKTVTGVGLATGRLEATGLVGGLGRRANVQINAGLNAGESFSGSMDREAIRRVIREHLNEIRSCYERQLQRSPDLFGKVVLQWDIVQGGKVQRASIKSSDLPGATAECILSRLATWTFPEPPSDQIGRVAYPFVFSSR